jgi:hypothetical protein
VAYGIAYFLVNGQLSEVERTHSSAWLGNAHPNAERFGAYLGLLLGLGISVKNGLKGWANIYLGNENYWNGILWRIIGPLLVIGVIGLIVRLRRRPLPRGFDGDVFPRAYLLIWLVLINQNLLAQLITGPWTVWSEIFFSLYYVLLFVLSGVILHHVHCIQTLQSQSSPPARGCG